MISQISIALAELVIPTETQTSEANAKIETQPVTVETKISKYSTYFKYLMSFHTFHSLNHHVFFDLKDNLLCHQFFLI